MRLEGMISVKAAILSGRYDVEKVWVDVRKKDHDTAFLLKRCQERKIVVQRSSRTEIEALAVGRTHGGILAEVKSRTYQSLEECFGQKDVPFPVLLEGVEDPFNLGYIMRSLYCAGCTGLILPVRNRDNAEGVILKSSAGAGAYMNIVCMDPAEAVAQCKKKGLYVYAAMRKKAIAYTEGNYTRPILLCIGGEMRGLSAGVLAQADQHIAIPYARDFRNALNAAAAGAVLAFEVNRQRLIGMDEGVKHGRNHIT